MGSPQRTGQAVDRQAGAVHVHAAAGAAGLTGFSGFCSRSSALIVHGYHRSSAAYRVQIALRLKGLKDVRYVAHDLPQGEQHQAAYRALNPQGLVPSLELDDGRLISQSLAIIEWLGDAHPSPPLLPSDPVLRAQVRAFALVIACDIHPLQNLKVLARVQQLAPSPEGSNDWARQGIAEGLSACETLLAQQAGPFCFGATPTLADICLVPQLRNARRFGVELSGFRRLREAEGSSLALPAFAEPKPEDYTAA